MRIQHDVTHVYTYVIFILKFIHVYQLESSRYNEKRRAIVHVETKINKFKYSRSYLNESARVRWSEIDTTREHAIHVNKYTWTRF